MEKAKIFTLVAALMLAANMLTIRAATAKDAIQATVEANGFTFAENGNPLSSGTYAVGTLKIFMIVSANEWPADLGTVRLDLAVKPGKPSPETKYTVPIRLRQAGGDLVLTPDYSTFMVTGISWEDYSDINVTVPQAILDDPSFNEDGTELLANLQIEPTLPGKHLDTVTTVKIYAKLVHPTASCLRTIAFITDNGLNEDLSDENNGIELTYKVHPSFSFQNVAPPQILYDILVVNSCAEAKSFDLALVVDNRFKVPTTGQPVKAYITNNVASTEEGLIDSFTELQSNINNAYGDAENFGSNLCLPELSLGGMKSLYAKASIDLIESGFTSYGNLPEVGFVYDGFTADVLSTAVDDCSGYSHPDSGGQASTNVKVIAVDCTGNNCP